MTSTSVIYDLCRPSPPPLKETLSMAVAVEVWRTEIREHRKNNTLSKMYLEADLSKKYKLQDAPSCVVHNVEKYLKKIGPSMNEWMQIHKNDFNKDDLLACFDEFVCDFDGTIDSVRTARRLINCDRISLEVRFKIACVYCLEEDILRMWPEVEFKEKSNFGNGELFYWVCRLKNQLYKLTDVYDRSNSSTSGILLRIANRGLNRLSLKHILDGLDSRTRLREVKRLNLYYGKTFCRHLLVVLSDEEVQELVDEYGDEMIISLVCEGECYALPVWTQIKNRMNVDVFRKLVRSMLTEEFERRFSHENNSFVQIWKTAPNFLRKAIVSDVLTENYLSIVLSCHHGFIRLSLVEAMLLDASIEDRKTFWNNQWTRFINKVDTKDVAYFMKLCLKDDCQIDEFKASILPIQHQVAILRLFNLFRWTNIQELYAFSKYWGFSEKSMQGIRSKLLKKGISQYEFSKASSINEFIEFSFEGDIILANEFKSQLLLSPVMWKQLADYLQKNFWLAIHFVDTLAPSQQVVSTLKKTRIVPFIKNLVSQKEFSVYYSYHLPIFMKWSFENDEQLTDFRKSLDADRIIQRIIRKGTFKRRFDFDSPDDCSALGCHDQMPHTSDYFLEDFLRWLMGSGEAFEELKKKYEDDDVFVRLMTMKASKKN